MGLLLPPPGFVSTMAEPPFPLMTWDEIADIAKTGRMDGRQKYDPKTFAVMQRHNNCAGASASKIVMKTVFDTRGVLVKLSDCFTYSLINGGRDQGAHLDAAMLSIQRDGVPFAATVGPNDIYPSQYDRAKATKEAQRFRVAEGYVIRNGGDLDTTQRTLFTGLVLGFKAGVAVHVGSNFDDLDSDGVAGGDNGYGNHAVHADGVVWLNRGSKPIDCLAGTGDNTWGLSYGDQGRMLLMWKRHFGQTYMNHSFYLIRTALDDSETPLPVPMEVLL